MGSEEDEGGVGKVKRSVSWGVMPTRVEGSMEGGLEGGFGRVGEQGC